MSWIGDKFAALQDVAFAQKQLKKLCATKEDFDSLLHLISEIDVPEAVSELQNDAGYQTAAQVQAVSAADRSYTDTALSALAAQINEALAALLQPEGIALTVPTTGWSSTADGYYCDLPVPAMTSAMLPDVSPDTGSDAVVEACGLSCCCQSLAGKLRVFAADIPAQPIPITLTITI